MNPDYCWTSSLIQSLLRKNRILYRSYGALIVTGVWNLPTGDDTLHTRFSCVFSHARNRQWSLSNYRGVPGFWTGATLIA